jgi:hypothetical protein
MAPPETHIQTWGPQERLLLWELANDIIVSQDTTPWLSFQFNVTFVYKMHVKGHNEILDYKSI